MQRLYEYLEARMPEKESKQKTVNCKFSVGCARMLIGSEKRTFDMDEIGLWLKWVRKQREGKIKDRSLTATDCEYGIEAWKQSFESNAHAAGSAVADTVRRDVGQEDSQ